MTPRNSMISEFGESLSSQQTIAADDSQRLQRENGAVIVLVMPHAARGRGTPAMLGLRCFGYAAAPDDCEFAPRTHLREGLTMPDSVDALTRGLIARHHAWAGGVLVSVSAAGAEQLRKHRQPR